MASKPPCAFWSRLLRIDKDPGTHAPIHPQPPLRGRDSGDRHRAPVKAAATFLRETDGLEKADGYCRSWRAWRGVCARSVGVDNKSMHEINA